MTGDFAGEAGGYGMMENKWVRGWLDALKLTLYRGAILTAYFFIFFVFIPRCIIFPTTNKELAGLIFILYGWIFWIPPGILGVVIIVLHFFQCLRLVLFGEPEDYEFDVFAFWQPSRPSVGVSNPYYREFQERMRENERREAEEREAQRRAYEEARRAREERERAEAAGRQRSDPLPRTFAEACAVLEVAEGLSRAEYKQAYRRKALEYHSDKYQDAGAKIRKLAEEEMKRINAAWDIIDRHLAG